MFKIKELCLLFFPFAVGGFFIPNELFIYNLSEWHYDTFLIILPAGVSMILFFTTLLLALILKYLNKKTYIKLSNHIPFLFFCLGLVILFADLFAPLQLSKLDGSNLKSNEPFLISLIEATILLAATFIFLKAKKLKKTFSDISILFIIFSISYFIYNLTNATLNEKQLEETSHTKKTSSLPNIYHIHLDAMQTDYFLQNIIDSKLEKDFQGFTLFQKNIANYPYTEASSTSYFTSTTYKNQSYPKWLKSIDSGLIKDLHEKDYHINIFATKSIFYTKYADNFKSNNETFKEHTDVKHPAFDDFISILVARILPNCVTNKALKLGRKIATKLNQPFKNKNISYPRTIAQGIEPYTGVLLLKDIIKTEKDRKRNGEYLFVQPLLPHGPYVISADCIYNQNKGNTGTRFMQQVQCATSLVTNFINELKTLKRYDNSIIIIQGDHGSGWAGFLQGKDSNYKSSLSSQKDLKPFKKKIHRWSSHHLESRSMALLMIKPQNANNTFKLNNEKTNLLDIYPTLATLANIQNKNTYEGKDLSPYLFNKKDKTKKLDQEQYFYYFSTGRGEKDVVYKVKIDFASQIPKFSDVKSIKHKKDTKQ